MRGIVKAGLVFGCLAAAATAAQAQSVNASLSASCTGNPGSQVALRWAHPTYNSTSYITPDVFTVKCNNGVASHALLVTNFSSQIEVQTEGGTATGYVVTATVNTLAGRPNTLTITHHGSEVVSVLGTGFTVANSAGPNQYGERNLRIGLPIPTNAASPIPQNVTVIGQVFGGNGAQMALRWGHPNYDDNAYFKLWKIKPGPSQLGPQFTLKDAKSELEIQTEGGVSTSYHLQIWITSAPLASLHPDLEVDHDVRPDDFSPTGSGVNFQWTNGNIYGERDITVQVPGLPTTP